ncbi:MULTISPECIES: 5-(carboxyamino)imidazole ribonucleotide synthase [Aliiglaciecola]|uniref:5-(carboxyamino)imidazole ribonucleotide synthase n=1 Tax=Aliiglaciecola TaxID=1406885 RepID=UPI001C083FE6|nr:MULTISPECIES: 5-(carboxyamino)imidazole ribonucleotide synthase [Aliiglaciecola]MBU2877635.1 5-(carboxyamino)imidazole ribonucleotide synthase [Aliiglaciecola lipolytica]MDO6713168.1 5-(carboxyamino)imidazole ribonucleotide synthase [Aliiglaciecola sp. 2_MG-2023]MDO6754248.1 5-(carboxyamino)imidazole ribonucleotide synthase [Aliiglaciecola sp. 1_MG-2023]
MNVLIYGSGQLAQMMYLSAVPLGFKVYAVDVANHTVVDPISKIKLDISIEQAIDMADALSVEFEHVPEDLLEQAQSSGKLYPSMQAILTGADRVREKNVLEKLQINNSKHLIITDIEQLDDAVAQLGEKLIIKASRDGYDGYGQWRLSSNQDLPALKQQLADLDLEQVPLIAEQMVPFDRELSLVGVRGLHGDIKFYPLAENLHHQGQLHVSVAPAPDIDSQLTAQAQTAFTKLVDEFDYVGVLAVEFFQVGNQLLVNEIAPRVHNSGHWSMQGTDCSQFENHMRAISGLPLGNTQAHGKSAMINIIGCDDYSIDLLSLDHCHLHLYGKSVRAKRKMGHINLTGDSYADLAELMTTLAKYVPVEHFPKLLNEADKLAKID